MLFARLTPRNKQDFMSLLTPHMPVLQAKALYWTRSRRKAGDLLDAFLLRMTGEMEAMKKTDNLRLWLVKNMYEDFLLQQEASSEGRNLLDKDAIIANFFPRRPMEAHLSSSPFALDRAARSK